MTQLMITEETVNCARRKMPVRYLVVHHTATDSIQSVIGWFKDPKSEKSAHYIIGKDGQLVQMVPENKAAWHCRGKNQQSIGIEVVSKNSPLTREQEVALTLLIGNLLHTHKLSFKSITGHKHIGTTRTECPGNLFEKYGDVFQWAKLRFSKEFPEVIA